MRKFNIDKAYERYVKQYNKTKAYFIKKGYKIPEDAYMLSKADLEGAINVYRASRTGKASGFTNFIRTLATGVFYDLNKEQALKLKEALLSLGITNINGKSLTIENLRIVSLSTINELLKSVGMTNSYDRQHFIGQNIYDSL